MKLPKAMTCKSTIINLNSFLYLALTLLCPFSSQSHSLICRAYYTNPNSISFGKLIKDSSDIKVISELNNLSATTHFNTRTKPEDHMVNSLIFYRKSFEFNLPEPTIDSNLYFFILNNSKETLEKNRKYNFFKNYLYSLNR